MKGNCGAVHDQCRAQARLFAVLEGYPATGDVAEGQCVSALGQGCVFCHDIINNRMTGHDCNIYGPHHEDCEPY